MTFWEAMGLWMMGEGPRPHPPAPHVVQPPGSSLCGQAAVAMLLGLTLEEGVELVGHRGGTNLQELETALKKKGVRLWDRVAGPPPTNGRGLYLCGARWVRGGGHWIVLDGGRWLDPSPGHPWPTGGRITAHWEVRERVKVSAPAFP